MLNKKNNIQLLLSSFDKYSEDCLIQSTSNKEEITYKVFFERAIEFLNYLKLKKKIKIGDKILIKIENSPEYLISIFACVIGGLIACPIDLQTPREKYKKLKKIIKASYEINKIEKIKYLKTTNSSLSDLDSNRICLIIFTSGSTGEPKGIQLSREEYLGSAKAFGGIVEYGTSSKIYHCLPMHYNAGVLNTFFAPIFYGSKIILGPQVKILNLFNFWNNLIEFNVNSTHIVPEIANALVKLKVDREQINKIEKIDKIISTGSHLYEETKEKFEKKYRKRILSCYGLTEIGGPITLQNWEDTFEENSVGRLIKDIKIKIIKKNKINQIFVRTPYLFHSYITEKIKFQKPKKEKNFFNTGDVGEYFNNQLYVYGRKKEIFKRGSEIISPQNIENICIKSKLIKDCAVFSKEDINKGSYIYLLIELRSRNAPIKKIEILKKFLAKKLKKIELPEKILPVPKILRNSNGKLKKNEMQKIYL